MLRDNRLDAIKGLSILAVICIHSHPFSQFDPSNRTALEVIVNQLCRFAVPCFFMVSGYLHAQQSNQSSSIPWPRIRSLLRYYVLFSVLYLLICFDWPSIQKHGYWRVSYWKAVSWVSSPETLFFQGTMTHLWFLPVLAWTVLLVPMLYRIIPKSVIGISLVAYGFLVYGHSYGSHLPIWSLISTPLAVCAAMLFYAIGMLWADSNFELKSRWAFLFLGAGAIGQCLEAFSIAENLDPTTVDYVFSTPLLAVGAFGWLMAHQASAYARLGSYSLGIYLGHMWWVELLRPFCKQGGWPLQLLCLLAVCIGSYIVSKFAKDVRRMIVMPAVMTKF